MKAIAIFSVMLISTLTMTDSLLGCGGGGQSSGSSPGGLIGNSGPGAAQMLSGPGKTINMARQATTAQVRAYNARMMPIRIANAKKARDEKLALRESRTQSRLAKLESQKQKQQAFLAGARTWTDRSGKFTLVAVLVDVSGSQVQLTKEDGSTVRVPLSRLSSADQTLIAEHFSEDTVMLASL